MAILIAVFSLHGFSPASDLNDIPDTAEAVPFTEADIGNTIEIIPDKPPDLISAPDEPDATLPDIPEENGAEEYSTENSITPEEPVYNQTPIVVSQDLNGITASAEIPTGCVPQNTSVTISEISQEQSTYILNTLNAYRPSDTGTADFRCVQVQTCDENGMPVCPLNGIQTRLSFISAYGGNPNLHARIYRITYDEIQYYAEELLTETPDMYTVSSWISDGICVVEYQYERPECELYRNGTYDVQSLVTNAGLYGYVTDVQSSDNGILPVSYTDGLWTVTPTSVADFAVILNVTIDNIVYEMNVRITENPEQIIQETDETTEVTEEPEEKEPETEAVTVNEPERKDEMREEESRSVQSSEVSSEEECEDTPEEESKPQDEPEQTTEEEEENATTGYVLNREEMKLTGEYRDMIITVIAPPETFPENAVLRITDTDSRQQNIAENAVEQERSENTEVAVSYTMDITVLNENGEEIQPANGNSVRVLFETKEAGNSNLTANVYHLQETDGNSLSANALDTEETESSVAVVTDGFSIYTIEFTYDSMQYVMQVGGDISVQALLDVFGLHGTVTDVVSSAPYLFSAEWEEDGDCIILSHEPFETQEWLDIYLDEIPYRITVTDSVVTGGSTTDFASPAQIANVYIDPSKLTYENAEITTTGQLTVAQDAGRGTVSWRGTYTYGGAPKSIGGFTVRYKNAARMQDGTWTDVVISYSNTQIHFDTRTDSSKRTNPIYYTGNNFTDTFNLFRIVGGTRPYPTVYTKSQYGEDTYSRNKSNGQVWNMFPRYGMTADVTISVPGAGDDDTVFITAYDINVRRSGNNFSSLEGASGTIENYSEAVEVLPADAVVYRPSNSQNVVSGNRVGLPSSGNIAASSYQSGIATRGRTHGTTMKVWSGGANGVLELYLLPGGITHSIQSSSTTDGRIDTNPDGTVMTSVSEAMTKAGYSGTYDILDVPNGKAVTYTMTPKDGFILNTLTVDGNDRTADAVAVTDADGKILYYTYSFPADSANHTIHVTWQPAINIVLVKNWDDNNDAAVMRPEQVSMQPKRDGMTYGDVLVLNNENQWTQCLYGQPRYRNYGTADQREYAYTFDETLVSSVYEEVTPHQVSVSGNTVTYTVTNRMKMQTLTVVKKVEGNQGDKNREWRFTVHLKDSDGTEKTGSVPAVITKNDGTTSSVRIVLHNGYASFRLKHGEGIQISSISSNSLYNIEEESANGYVQVYSISPSPEYGNMEEQANTTGERTLTQDTTVTFTNTKQTPVPTGVSLEYKVIVVGILIAGLLLALTRIRGRNQ